jgi:hypothetical protein
MYYYIYYIDIMIWIYDKDHDKDLCCSHLQRAGCVVQLLVFPTFHQFLYHTSSRAQFFTVTSAVVRGACSVNLENCIHNK